MSPVIIFTLAITAFIGGGYFYSYHTGVRYGERVCNEEKLAVALKKTQMELIIKEQITEFQKGQIGEAQQYVETFKLETEKLREQLSEIKPDSEFCIPNSVLDALRRYRSGGKNS